MSMDAAVIKWSQMTRSLNCILQQRLLNAHKQQQD